MKVARSDKGMVVAAHPLAAEAGRDLLASGGTAVEAAVAVSLALGVIEPFASGLGGGGFMMISPQGRLAETVVIDGRGKLSSLASEEYIYPKGVMLPWVPKTGPMSVAVPGLGRMLSLALERFGGRLPLARLAEPAIRLAADGFAVGDVFVYCSSLFEGTVRSTPECARIYTNKGVRFQRGERLVQTDLARTLRLVAEQGFESCYSGEIGDAIQRTINATGPIWGDDDLARYEAKIRAPLLAELAGCQVVTTPPPSRGGAGIIRTLRNYDKDPVRLAPVLRATFRELHPLVGDPDGLEDCLEIDRLQLLAGQEAPAPGGGTTHFVVVDSDGTIVTMSQTLGHFFGSGVVVEGYGIVLNDDISDMERKPGHPNSVGANKRSVANMAPTIVFRDSRPYLALGTPGSLRIFPAMAQVIGKVLFEGMDLESAVAAGRIHWEENRYFFEGDIFAGEAGPAIRARARQELDQPVDERRSQDLFFGGIHAVAIGEDGTITGVADPRREGVAVPL